MKRVDALDALRAFAVVQMVQGHTLDALLATSLRAGMAFEVWRWVRGLTAPAFLFCAGFAFVFAYRRRPDGTTRRLKRAALLIALGYGLRTPWLQLLSGEVSVGAWHDWALVDVLQCIGVSIALLEASERLPPQLRRWLLACVGALCFCAGPAGIPMPLPTWLANYFGQGTLFALLPWSGHVAAGALCADLWFDPAGVRLSWAPMLFIASAMLFDTVARGASAHALRLVCILALFGLLMRIVHRGSERVLRELRFVSASSLFVYVTHIVVVYAADIGLATRPGPTLSLALSLACAIGLILLSLALYVGYRGLRSGRLTRRAIG